MLKKYMNSSLIIVFGQNDLEHDATNLNVLAKHVQLGSKLSGGLEGYVRFVLAD